MTRKDAHMIAEELVKVMKEQGLAEDKVLGIDEVAKVFGWSRQTVYNHIKDIPHTKVSGQLRFFQSDIFRMIRR